MAQQTPPAAAATPVPPPQSAGQQERAGDRIERFELEVALRDTTPPPAATATRGEPQRPTRSSGDPPATATSFLQGPYGGGASASGGGIGDSQGSSQAFCLVTEETVGAINGVHSWHRRHLNPKVIEAILTGHLAPKDAATGEKLGYLSVHDIKYPPPEGQAGQISNLVLLTAPTQNGKTREMLALAWKAFFCHGMPSYIFLRSDATAYSDIRSSVESFNKEIVSFLMREGRAGGLVGEQLDIKHYLLDLSTLQLNKEIKPADVFNDHTESYRTYKPILRCRLLTAQNVRIAATSTKEMPVMVEGFGLTPDGERLNVMVFVDESQNTRQSEAGDKYKLERNLFTCIQVPGSLLLGAARTFCTANELPVSLVDNIRRKSLRNMAALYVEVTATPEPTFILESSSAAQVIQCKVDPRYYGYLKELPETRRIKIQNLSDVYQPPVPELYQRLAAGISLGTALERGAAASGPPPPSEADLIVGSCKAFAETSNGDFEHIIVYHGLQRNDEMDDVASRITESLDKLERPVVVLCAYAKSGQFGSTIYFNRHAADRIVPHILAAEQELFCSKNMFKELITAFPDKYDKSRVPKNGEFIPHPTEDGRFYIMLKDTLESLAYDKADDNRFFRFPSKMLYRLRAQLTIVHAACKMADVDPQSLFLVTLGRRLLREGLTIKTWDHNLPPTKQICSMSPERFMKRPAVEMLQALGRLCGLRRAPYDKAPVLYVNDCLEIFEGMVNFNGDLSKHVRAKLTRHPGITLGAACAGAIIPEALQQLVCKNLQGDRRPVDLFEGAFTCEDPERLTRLRHLFENEAFFSVQERAMLYRMFEYLRDTDNNFAVSDEEPTCFIDFPDLLGHLQRKAMEDNKPFTQEDVDVYNTATGKLVDHGHDTSQAPRPEEIALILEFELEKLDDGWTSNSPILVLKDRTGDQGGGNWGIVLMWNFMKWLTARCDCGDYKAPKSKWYQCSECLCWFHDRCVGHLRAWLATAPLEQRNAHNYTCAWCPIMVV